MLIICGLLYQSINSSRSVKCASLTLLCDESNYCNEQSRNRSVKGNFNGAMRKRVVWVVLDTIDSFCCFENAHPLAILCTEGGQEWRSYNVYFSQQFTRAFSLKNYFLQ